MKDMDFLKSFDVIAASPPCQTHSSSTYVQGKSTDKIDLIPQTREALVASGKTSVCYCQNLHCPIKLLFNILLVL
jgi:site-specific DNA-cytosine methylase